MMRCRECGRRRETASAHHKGGGGYNRAPRWYSAQICQECAENLLTYATPGHMTTSNWSISGLRAVVDELKRRAS